MTLLRFEVGAWGACHLFDPVGGAVNRILLESATSCGLWTFLDIPFPGIQTTGLVEVTLVDFISQIDLQAGAVGFLSGLKRSSKRIRIVAVRSSYAR
jgi:hypothetical protein